MGASRKLLVCTLILVVMLLVGCTATSSQDPEALKGVQWTLSASSETSADLTKLGIFAEFDGTRMTGFSGVNTYTGPYTVGADGTFSAGPLATTMMAGPPQLMTAETLYLGVLDAAESYEIADKTLTLTTGDGKTLTYQATPAPELAGSSWKVTNYNNGKEAVVGMADGSEVTLSFGTDGTVSGNGGVNTFNGPYESGEDSIKIGPLTSTLMAGPDELMAQEQQYLAALEAATTWEITNGVLTLRDDSGATQVLASQK